MTVERLRQDISAFLQFSIPDDTMVKTPDYDRLRITYDNDEQDCIPACLLCRQAGFRELHTRTVCRNARIDLHKVIEELRQRKRPSYRLLTDAELEDGLRLIAQEWYAKGGQWIDPKPYVLITAVK
jgi:hypothetical protein